MTRHQQRKIDAAAAIVRGEHGTPLVEPEARLYLIPSVSEPGRYYPVNVVDGGTGTITYCPCRAHAPGEPVEQDVQPDGEHCKHGLAAMHLDKENRRS